MWHSRGPRSYAANLVESLVTPEATMYFHYDGNLQRYAIEEDGVATYYVWDGLRLLETRNADGSLKARFTHGLARIEGIGSVVEAYVPNASKRYYMLMDDRGTAHAVVDESKVVVASRLYNAFGGVTFETGTWPADVPFRYQSNWLHLTDLPDGSPLYLSPTRVYHAGVGRFLQRDPLASFLVSGGQGVMSLGQLGTYEYAKNCPTLLYDASGLYCCPENIEVKTAGRLRGGFAVWDYYVAADYQYPWVLRRVVRAGPVRTRGWLGNWIAYIVQINCEVSGLTSDCPMHQEYQIVESTLPWEAVTQGWQSDFTQHQLAAPPMRQVFEEGGKYYASYMDTPGYDTRRSTHGFSTGYTGPFRAVNVF